VGRLKRICKDGCHVAGAVQETSSAKIFGKWGRWFPERGCILEHQNFAFAKMILRDRCSRKTHWYEAVSSAHNLPFLKKVSQNCFVLDVVKFKEWRSLAELFRFWRCDALVLQNCLVF
jgi:hypothetical protein